MKSWPFAILLLVLIPPSCFVAGVSFVPKEIGEHLVNIKKNGRHIPSSPISVMISQSEIGDASRVRVSGPGLSEARTFEPAEFIIDTRDAGNLMVNDLHFHLFSRTDVVLTRL